MKESDLGAGARRHVSKLERDIASSDENDPPGKPLQFEKLIALGEVLFPGDAYNVQADILINPSNPAGINTIVPDAADISWGIRTSLTAEF